MHIERLESRNLLAALEFVPLPLDELQHLSDSDGASSSGMGTGTGRGEGIPNRAPILTVASPSNSTDEDTVFTINLADIINAAGSTTVTDDDPLNPVGGIVVIGEDGFRPYEYSINNGATFAEFASPSSASAIALPPDAVLRLQPMDASGVATLTFAAWDQTDGTLAGGLVNAETRGGSTAFSDELETFTLAVTEVNDPPTATSDLAEVDEDASVVIDVLFNDTRGPANEDAQLLTVTGATALQGSVTINENQTLTYEPNDDFFGDDTIEYTISDDGTTLGVLDARTATATVSVTVHPTIDPPTANDETFSLAENTPSATEVGTIIFTSPDWQEGVAPNLTLHIIEGDPNGAFAVDNDGVIRVLNSLLLDFESTPVFTLTIEADDSNSKGTAIATINLTDVDEEGPIVTAVYVSSSTWSPNFLNELGGHGYSVPLGDGQSDPLPWSNLDTLSVKFNEPLTPPTQADFRLLGANVANYESQIASFAYDDVSHMVTISLGSDSFGPDRLRLLVADTVTDLLDNPINNSGFLPKSPVPDADHGRIDVDDTGSLTLTREGGSENFSIPTDVINGGDFVVFFGTESDHENGVMITSVRENGRRATSASERTGSINPFTREPWFDVHAGSYFIPANFTNQADANVDVAAAFFPFDKFLAGAGYTSAFNAIPINGGGLSHLVSSPGIRLHLEFAQQASGQFKVDLQTIRPGASSQNGILLVTAAKNEDNFALSQANADGSFTIYNKGNNANSDIFEQDPVAFVYIDHTSPDLIFGRVHGDGNAANNDDNFSILGGEAVIEDGGTGRWHLTIPGHSDSTGTLIISPAGGETFNIDNLVSYEFDATNGYWVIESLDLPGATILQNVVTEDAFSFAFIPDEVPGGIDFRFNVLPGDANRSGGVSVNDVAELRTAIGTRIGDSQYNPFVDLNGSGVIAVNDLGAIRTNLGATLPTSLDQIETAVAAVATEDFPDVGPLAFDDIADRRRRARLADLAFEDRLDGVFELDQSISIG